MRREKYICCLFAIIILVNLVSTVTTSLSILTIVAQVLTVLGFFVYFFPGRVKSLDLIFRKYLIPNIIIIPAIATLGSLFFSEVAHYTPCVLCWYQRIFMYPLVVILAIAYLIKDKKVAHYYAIGLSVIGAMIALYHYLLQVKAVSSIVPCSNSAVAVDCAQKVFMHFGYITIPMMALSAFLLIIVLSLLGLRKKS